MTITILIIILGVFLTIRRIRIIYKKRAGKSPTKSTTAATSKPPLTGWRQKLYTVGIFTKLSTRRFFRDRLALFFTILFPLIFLFVFGSLSNNGKVSFSVAIINQSKSPYASTVINTIESNKVYKVNKSISTLNQAEAKMDKNQLDGAVLIPANFGLVQPGQHIPSGQITVVYTKNQESAGQTLTSLLPNSLKGLNAHFVVASLPFNVNGNELTLKSLTSFDYTFSGLLGFSIVGVGIFGPINVFPELKKQGVLRRLHTTPIRVWQYFLSTMFSQAISGSVAVAVQFVVALTVFHLKVDGNYLEILAFLVLSIFMILGIGLAIGGWAKNERQAAPLGNILVFPMLFLSGTFFPRFLMPEWLQSVTNYLPLTPVIDGLRMLTTEGKSLIQIGPQIGLVALWLVVVYAIAFRVFRWE